MPPSRFVLLADQLEEHGVIERRENLAEHRGYALHLTVRGSARLAQLRDAAPEHGRPAGRGALPRQARGAAPAAGPGGT